VEGHRIPYGAQTLAFSFPSGALAALLEPPAGAPTESEDAILARALDEPTGSPGLFDLARGKRSAAILIPGKTRVAGTAKYLPLLIEALNRAGIPDACITVLLATGTHEHHLECDFQTLVGPRLARRVACVAHDCHDAGNLRHLGTTSFGTPVFINRSVMDADVIIPTGRIVPHYFAGFTGGRKALIPGVAGFKTICANHRLTLDDRGGINPLVGCCLLDGNPVHMDMVEGARWAEPTFVFNTIMDHNGRVVAAVSGDWQAAHEAGCAQAEKLFRLTLDRPVDAVITSAGGRPYDCNFMQSLKAIFNVKDIVKPGGYMLWVAECAHGIQDEFLSWCSIASQADLEQAVRKNYDLKGHNSLMLRALSSTVNVALLSKLPPDVVTRLGLHPVASMEEGIGWIRAGCGHNIRYAVAPFANVICATTRPPVL
jgi:lactate racemase